MSDYEMRERMEFNDKYREVAALPLADRKAAAKMFFEAMRDEPELVAERIGWLLAGNYGYGGMKAAEEVLKNKRMNRMAWLTQAVGVCEWQCPQDMQIRMWKKLTKEQKEALDNAILAELKGK